MGAGIHEIVGLVGDLAKALYRVGTQPGLPGMVRGIRDLVPVLERIITVVTAALGPPLVAALNEVARLLENLTGATGPMSTFLRLITTTLRVVNGLIDRFPALGVVIGTVLSVVLINRFITRVGALAAVWFAVAGAASTAARAQAAATGGAAAAAVGGGGLILPGGRGRPAAVPEASGCRQPGGGMAWRRLPSALPVPEAPGVARGGVRGAPGRAAAALRGAGGIGGLARAGIRAGGRFFLPAAAVMGGIDAISAQREGNIGSRRSRPARRCVSGATLGLIPRMRTPARAD